MRMPVPCSRPADATPATGAGRIRPRGTNAGMLAASSNLRTVGFRSRRVRTAVLLLVALLGSTLPAGSAAAGTAHGTKRTGIADKPSAQAAASNGEGELIRLASTDDPAALEALLARGARPDAPGPRGTTALQAAAAEGLVGNIRVLLRHGARIDAPAARGATALAWAARHGRDAAVQALLEAGADAGRAAATSYQTPLSMAVAAGHAPLARTLAGAAPAVMQGEATLLAVLEALTDLDAALQAGAMVDADAKDLSGLYDLVVPHVGALAAASPAFAGSVAGMLADCDAGTGRALLDHLGNAASQPAMANALLLRAADRRRPDLVSTAIRLGADVNARDTRGSTALASSVARGDAASARVLLLAHADPAGIDAERLDALAHEALEQEQRIQLLVRVHGLDARGSDGQTMLFRAAADGDLALVESLLRRGANPSASVKRWKGDAGWTPLHIAAAAGNLDIVERLLEAGAKVDAANAAGRTPLAFAALYGRTNVAAVLLAAGADPVRGDRQGQTPRDLAAARGDRDTQTRMDSKIAIRAASAAGSSPAATPAAAQAPSPMPTGRTEP